MNEREKELLAQVAALREALCGLMGIDGSRESLDRMRVGIALGAESAPDDDAAEAAMRCVDVLSEPPAAALDALKREVAERVRGVCADAAHHERADGSACCQTEEIIRGLDLSALLAEARHE